jgi:hypothetical protein
VLWGFSLLLWAVGAAVLGEAVRGLAARWVRGWASPEPVERFVLDFYLGGAVLYLVAAVELGAFVAPVVLGLPIVGAAVVAGRVLAGRRRGGARVSGERFASGLIDPWVGVAAASALGLFVVEVAAAVPIPTGNTFDSSLLTTYVGLLLQHGSVPLSFRPYGTPAILYPQGTTVWFGWAQLVFGLPPARTALLVTPLFLGLVPLSGYVLGRRWLDSGPAGAAFALALAWLGPSTRALVGGSNDFAVALPLVLLLAAQSRRWAERPIPSATDALGFGVLLGYSAALNVVGTEWLLPALVVVAGISTPAFAGRVSAWFGRWAVAFAAALVAGIPSWFVLARAHAAPSSLAGNLTVPPGGTVGLSVAQFVGSIDPFLFHVGDVELSPIPVVRLELAALLVAAVVVLLFLRSAETTAGPWSRWGIWAGAAVLVLIGWLGLLTASRPAGSPLRYLDYLSSGSEFSLALFTLYGLLAAAPLGLALEDLVSTYAPAVRSGRPSSRRPRGTLRALAPAALAVAIVVPAVVLTPVALGPVLSQTYAEFGNVTAGDFALLAYAGSHVGAGTRILVAPGSAGEFLPGYARGVVLLYPMVPGFRTINASYAIVLRELTNGTLDATGLRALASLDLDLIVVTGNNTVLWKALWASPLLNAQANGTRTFPVVFHDEDAWLFDAAACRTGSTGCA